MLAEPSHPEIRQTLAELNVQQGDSKGALAVLAGTAISGEGNLENARRSLHLEAVTRCIANSDAEQAADAQKAAQKAVMLTPWDKRTWQALAFVHTASRSDTTE